MNPSFRRATIFKVNQLGDNVVFLPVVERLVAERVFESLTVWTTPLAAPLYARLLRSDLNLEIVAREDFYPAWKAPSKLFALIHRVRSRKNDIVLVAEDMGNTAYFLGLLSGASRRLGIRPPYLKIPGAITRAIHLPPEAPAAEKSWMLGRALAHEAGLDAWPATPPPPHLTFLCSKPAETFDIVIHAGASREYKRWPLARYLDLAARLSRNFRIGWFELPDTPQPVHPVKVIPAKDLEDLVSHLNHASLFIGNNSGPMNIASALGVPSVILSGPNPRCWDPYWYADRCRVLRDESLPCIACDPPDGPIREVCTNHCNPMACMNFWSVERVEQEVRNWVGHHGKLSSDRLPTP